MKTIARFLVFAFTAMAAPLQADSLTVPNTFTAGSPAVAAEVNANFDAVKSSVDDNDARINTNTTAISNLETAKQNRVTGICPSGYAIRTINSDGTVICEPDNDSGGDIQGVTASGGLSGGGTTGTVDLRLSSGYVSVAAQALVSSNDLSSCRLTRYTTAGAYFTGGNYCYGVAPVQLPHNATLTSLACSFYDATGTPTSSADASLTTVQLQTGLSYSVLSTTPTVDAGYIQILTDHTPTTGYETVNNASFSYYLRVGFNDGTNLLNSNLRFYMCSIGYTY